MKAVGYSIESLRVGGETIRSLSYLFCFVTSCFVLFVFGLFVLCGLLLCALVWLVG